MSSDPVSLADLRNRHQALDGRPRRARAGAAIISPAFGHVVEFLSPMRVASVAVYAGSVEKAVSATWAGVYADPGCIEYIETAALALHEVFACAASQELDSTGLSSMLGSMMAVRADKWGGCCVTWWYHVAPLVRVRIRIGRIRFVLTLVIDPSMFDKPGVPVGFGAAAAEDPNSRTVPARGSSQTEELGRAPGGPHE